MAYVGDDEDNYMNYLRLAQMVHRLTNNTITEDQAADLLLKINKGTSVLQKEFIIINYFA